jgi:hypothetical protein
MGFYYMNEQKDGAIVENVMTFLHVSELAKHFTWEGQLPKVNPRNTHSQFDTIVTNISTHAPLGLLGYFFFFQNAGLPAGICTARRVCGNCGCCDL